MKERISAIPPFGLRMPSEVKGWVETKAKELDRSQNYVIVQVLRNCQEKEKAGSPLTA